MTQATGKADTQQRAAMVRTRLASLHRSMQVYWDDAARAAAMDQLYRRFVRPGDLVFDIGAHVGDRIGSFRRLGARVVAVEPQDDCAGIIRSIFDGDADVLLQTGVCAKQPGQLMLHINTANATVATVSDQFVAAADGAVGWEDQVWDRATPVAAVTLDQMIARHGCPAFVKIDVEGFEAEVLAGLSRPLAALSFEFTTIQRDVALAGLSRLAALGTYGFDMALGESQQLTFDRWISAGDIANHLGTLPHEANSGDIYALLNP